MATASAITKSTSRPGIARPFAAPTALKKLPCQVFISTKLYTPVNSVATFTASAAHANFQSSDSQ